MKKLRVTVEGKVYEVTVEILDQGPQGSPFNPVGTPAPAAAPVVSAPIASASVSAPVSAPSAAASSAPAGPGAVVSPLAGKVVSITAQVGQAVKEGDVLLALEAMKMNTYINAIKSGTVKKVLVAVGDAVNEGQTLIEIE